MQHHYAKGSPQRAGLTAALETLQKKGPLEVPIVVGGKEVGSNPHPCWSNTTANTARETDQDSLDREASQPG